CALPISEREIPAIVEYLAGTRPQRDTEAAPVAGRRHREGHDLAPPDLLARAARAKDRTAQPIPVVDRHVSAAETQEGASLDHEPWRKTHRRRPSPQRPPHPAPAATPRSAASPPNGGR